MVAGKIRKWRGALVDVELPKLRAELEASREYLFETSEGAAIVRAEHEGAA